MCRNLLSSWALTGITRIQVNTSGLTYYETNCFDINRSACSVRSIGNRTFRIPGNIDVSNGTVAVTAFEHRGTAAMLAGRAESKGDRR